MGGREHPRVGQPARVSRELDGLSRPAGRHSSDADLQRHRHRPLADGADRDHQHGLDDLGPVPDCGQRLGHQHRHQSQRPERERGRPGLVRRQRERRRGHRGAGDRERGGDAQGPVGHAGGQHDHRRERALPLLRREGRHRLLRRGDGEHVARRARAVLPRGVQQQPDDHLQPLGWAELHRRRPGLQGLRDDRHLRRPGLGGRQQQRCARPGRDRPRRRHRPALPRCERQRRDRRRRHGCGHDHYGSRRQLSLHGCDSIGHRELHRLRRPGPGLAHRIHGHHRHDPQLRRCLRWQRLPGRRLRIPRHRRDDLLPPGSRLVRHEREWGPRHRGERHRRGHDGAAGRQSRRHRDDHDGRGRHVRVQRPHGRRRRLHDQDQRHGRHPRQLLRHDELRPGGAARGQQPGQQCELEFAPGLSRAARRRRAQLRLPRLARDRRHDLLRPQRQRDAGLGRERDRRGRGDALPGHERKRGHQCGRAAGRRQRHDRRERALPLHRADQRKLHRQRAGPHRLQLHGWCDCPRQRPGDRGDPEAGDDVRRKQRAQCRPRLPGPDGALGLGHHLERRQQQRGDRRRRVPHRGGHPGRALGEHRRGHADHRCHWRLLDHRAGRGKLHRPRDRHQRRCSPATRRPTRGPKARPARSTTRRWSTSPGATSRTSTSATRSRCRPTRRSPT